MSYNLIEELDEALIRLERAGPKEKKKWQKIVEKLKEMVKPDERTIE